jgi:hypothetical protein
MKTRALGLFLSCLLLTVVFASCTLPDEGCSAEDLAAPDLTYPVWETILTHSPTLDWVYSSECEPDEFVVEIGVAFGAAATAAVPGDSSSWTVPAPLTPANEYLWSVVAYKDGVAGPPSTTGSFWTGPVCDSAALVAPTIVDPADFGVETSAAWQALVWEYPDTTCVPDYYVAELRLATDTSFSGPNLMDEPTSGPPMTRQVPMALLDDCTGYVWRVRAVASATYGPWSEIARFHTDYSVACGEDSVYDFFPTCPTADLTNPIPFYPDTFAVVPDLIPTFSWDYPELCFPEGYRIEVTTYGDYSEGTISGGTGNPSTDWAPAMALEPATKYEWRVAPINDTTLGPFSTSIRFWTGPLCDTASLVAPVLEIPENSHEVDTPTAMFSWDYPDACIPESYEWYLTTDITFTTYDEFFDPGVPSDTIMIADTETLADCTIYLWRVRANNSDGAGPFSATFNFYTNFDGTCPSVAPPPPAEDVACPAGEVYNPATDRCELIDCTSITDQDTCESYSHCTWTPNNACQ